MSIFESIAASAINAIDAVALRYASLMKGQLTDYCNLDTAIDDVTLVTHQRALVSYIDIHGMLTHMGDAEFSEICQTLELLYNNFLVSANHSLQWVFYRAGSRAEDIIEAQLTPARSVAKTLQFQEKITQAIFAERLQVLKKYVVQEGCTLVFKTHPCALSAIEHKTQRKEYSASEKIAQMRAAGIPVRHGEFSQSTAPNVARLHIVHQAALQSLLNQLGSQGLNLKIELLDCHRALRHIRQLQHPEETAAGWRPVLPGDPIPVRAKPVLANERDHLFYPIIGSQLFKRTAEIKNDIVKIGNDYWGTVSMELSPQQPQRFDELFRAIPAALDWRFSLGFLGGNKRFVSNTKRKLTGAKACRLFNSDHNDPIINGCTHLLKINENGEMLVGMRCQLSIRASSMAEATHALHLCARLLQGWGNCDTSFERGDPLDALVATLPGLDSLDTGTTLVQPAREAAMLAPITRPVSPWQEYGANLYRTRDGRLYPVQSCSALQPAWLSLFLAKPGSGKSVMLNAQNLNLCLTPGISKLPRISILDIGPSSRGLIELLHALLPEHMREQAIHRTLKQDRASSINPFDTPLGMRFPHSAKATFLKSFLMLLFTEDGQTMVASGVGELVTALIQETYRHFSDDASPKEYAPHVETEIDRIIQENNDWFYSGSDASQQNLTWWQVVDVLTARDESSLATLAQRHAVPLLVDLTEILHGNDMLKDVYARTVRDKDIMQHLLKMVRSAINEYTILAHPTQFNIGVARVVALDLASVTAHSSGYHLKKTGLMYMLAREALCGSMYFDARDIVGLPDIYRHYHQQRIDGEAGEIKRVCMDEYHRIGALEAVARQVEQDAREGRKYRVEMLLASQRHQDFDDTLISLATSIYICNGATGNTLDEICQTFHLTGSERHALKYEVHGAGSDGASFLFKSETNAGWVSQVLVNSLGLIELWALASTAEDALLRKQLAEKIPYFSALQLLAKRLTTGSCRSELTTQIKTRGVTAEKAMEELLQELITRYQTDETDEINEVEN